jgi:hypothetical protein
MFGWFRRKKKQEDIPPVRAIHPHDLIGRRALSITAGVPAEHVVVIDHTSDMIVSPLYSYLPGNIWHQEYLTEIRDTHGVVSGRNPYAPDYGVVIDQSNVNTCTEPTPNYAPEPYVAPASSSSNDSSYSSDSGSSSYDSGSSFSSDSGGSGGSSD